MSNLQIFVKMKRTYFLALLLCMCMVVLGVEDTLDEIAKVSITVQTDELDVVQFAGTNEDYIWSSKLQDMADHGHAAALNAVGYCYQFGNGCEKNLVKAVDYYERAAELGNHKALNNLGQCYEHGNIVEQDFKQAYLFYKKAAMAGHEQAMNNLAQCYMRGMGTPIDYYKARAWFEKTANSRGDRVAIVNTGYLYYKIGDDYDKAFKYLSKGAEMESPGATTWLAVCYMNGYGCKQDIPTAISLFEKVLTMPERLSNEEYDEIQDIIRKLKNHREE